MEQFIKYSLFVHVLAGCVSLLAGLGAIIFRNKIKQHPKIRVDMDLFQMGITLFNPDLQKESYIVKF